MSILCPNHQYQRTFNHSISRREFRHFFKHFFSSLCFRATIRTCRHSAQMKLALIFYFKSIYLFPEQVLTFNLRTFLELLTKRRNTLRTKILCCFQLVSCLQKYLFLKYLKFLNSCPVYGATTLCLGYWIPDPGVHWVVLRSTQPFILLRSIKWVPGTPGYLVVKSKLFPCRGSVAFRQLNPVHRKVP